MFTQERMSKQSKGIHYGRLGEHNNEKTVSIFGKLWPSIFKMSVDKVIEGIKKEIKNLESIPEEKIYIEKLISEHNIERRLLKLTYDKYSLYFLKYNQVLSLIFPDIKRKKEKKIVIDELMEYLNISLIEAEKLFIELTDNDNYLIRESSDKSIEEKSLYCYYDNVAESKINDNYLKFYYDEGISEYEYFKYRNKKFEFYKWSNKFFYSLLNP